MIKNLLFIFVLSMTIFNFGCGGGGGSTSGTVILPPSSTTNQTLSESKIENMTDSSNFSIAFNNFQTNEEGIVIVTSRNPADSNYSYSISSSTSAVAPTLKVSEKKNYSPAPQYVQNCDFRMRLNEKYTSLLSGTMDRRKMNSPSRIVLQQKYNVGDKVNFWSLNSLNWPPRSDDWVYVTATCKAVGTHCYLFEDDATVSGYEKYDPSAWSQIRDEFDNNIYSTDTTTFGNEPNPGLDGDSRIFLLFTPNVNKQRASGYFDSTNELTQAEASRQGGGGVYYSNEKEMLYMQVPTSTWKWSDQSYRVHVLSVMAHEFLHMIVYNQHVLLGGSAVNEEDWLNEGLAQVAQDMVGYGYQYGELSFVISPFLAATNSYSLTHFTFNLSQYGMSYLFVRYLIDQGYSPKQLVSTTNVGTSNVEHVTGKPFNDIFQDWATALYLSNTGISTDKKYNYTSINLRSAQKDGTNFNGPNTVVESLPFNATSGNTRSYSPSYYKMTTNTVFNGSVKITDTSGGNLSVTHFKVIKK